MAHTAVTPSPGFISIAVSDVERSAAFYVEHLRAVRDSFTGGLDRRCSSAGRPWP